LATGGIPKTLQIPGKDLNNIFTLRSLSDADHILSALEKAAKVVVVGASFIGMETAASLKQKGLDVTVVAPEDIPFAHVFGEQVGKMFLDLHKEKDVQFYLGSSVSEFKGNSNVQQVILEDGKMLDADLVLVGVGIRPATDYIKGIETLKDGGIAVDKHFKAADDVYAAGDIVRFPYWRNGQDIRIEHWRTAEQQGRIAALNMTGKDLEYKSVPFFWTMQSGVHFRYVGHAKTWDKVIIDGDVKAKKFMAYYIHNNKITAVAGIQRDKEIAAVHELMRTNRMPPVSLVKEGKVDWLKRIRIPT
jgi:NADPH-dependent 2,4-dienoyl-CoA reductase/sulfur reductase-like enzyme